MTQFDKIILIDDDPIFLFLTKEIIESSAFYKNNLITYMNGVRALRDIEEERLNELNLLVFVDLSMPIMDGWEFLEALSHLSLRGESKVYVVSSSINNADKKMALTYDLVEDYISKPLSNTCLVKIHGGTVNA